MMHCDRIKVDGHDVIVCGGRRQPRCVCGNVSEYQCDWKTGRDTTCDLHLCEQHAQEVGENKHLCPEHQRAYLDWRKRNEQKT